MSDGISDRLRVVRTDLGLSQRAMAEATACSLRGWQSWEYGRTAPSAEVLAQLVKLGFDANWILTGEGERRRGVTGGGVGGGDPELMEEIQQLRAAGLDDLFLLARRGTQASLWRLLQILHERPGVPYLPRDIQTRMAEMGEPAELADVVADCRLLVMHALVKETGGPKSPQYLVEPGAILRPTQAVDVLQAVRETVRMLGVRVLPAIRRQNRTGYLTNIEIRAPIGRGREVLAAIRQAAVSYFEAPDWDGPERVFVALGIAVDDGEQDLAE